MVAKAATATMAPTPLNYIHGIKNLWLCSSKISFYGSTIMKNSQDSFAPRALLCYSSLAVQVLMYSHRKDWEQGYPGAYHTYLLQLPHLPSYLVNKLLPVRVELCFHKVAQPLRLLHCQEALSTYTTICHHIGGCRTIYRVEAM